ncbi:hypothetical protein AB4039_16635 [Streptomyces sp. M-16]|uniref:hypothetical protein n=1 Tax=Streptomyces sp. M-16 TaxID=3233040 RepID=UPI003F94E44C
MTAFRALEPVRRLQLVLCAPKRMSRSWPTVEVIFSVPAGDDGLLLLLDVRGERVDAALGGARDQPPGAAGDAGSLASRLRMDSFSIW